MTAQIKRLDIKTLNRLIKIVIPILLIICIHVTKLAVGVVGSVMTYRWFKESIVQGFDRRVIPVCMGLPSSQTMAYILRLLLKKNHRTIDPKVIIIIITFGLD